MVMETLTANSGITGIRKVAIVFESFGPYHLARVEAAALECEILGVQLSQRSRIYSWTGKEGTQRFRSLTLFNGAEQEQTASVISRLLREKMPRGTLDAICVNGWGDFGALQVIRWAHGNGIPVVVMSESSGLDARRSRVKEAVKRSILRFCSGALVGGRAHAEYVARLGVDKDRIFLGYDAIDNSYFQAGADNARAHENELRRRMGLPEQYFLASARFVEKKNLPWLIEAYARYRERALDFQRNGSTKAPPWGLVLLGDGALRGDLERLISELRLGDAVRLPGFKQYDELPIYYGLGGAFVHASTVEQWGLVVNEAMAAGLPVLVSNRCGCAQDLVVDGVNGFTFDPDDREELAQRMYELTLSPEKRAEEGRASKTIIANWGPERFAQGLREAVEVAVKNPVRNATFADRCALELFSRRTS